MVPCQSTMSLKEVKRTAAVAWSPPLQTSPLLATGTLAGALDASFSTHAELEIHDLQLEDKTTSSHIKATISCPSRFNRLAWSAHNSSSADGVLVGGCEDGTVSFWNVSDLLKKPNNESALIARCEAHQGPVRGLQVNPFQPFLVASGATDAEIWLWDLNNLQQPYSPSATKSSKLEDITDLAWNRIVPHILATASNSGATVVWDLKSRKEVLQLSTPGQRISMSAIAWNPENATQLLVASDDDQFPLIYSWDLRNARAPEKTLSGHAKGILSLAWCPKDAELLLSCGKDSKSMCWNPKSGQVVAELTHSDNWMFDVQWCPRNPDLFSTASFSGLVEVSSFQSIMSGGGTGAGGKAAGQSTAEDFFTMASSGMTQRAAAPTHVQIPKWLRRPIGVSFGFGGRVISFSSLTSSSTRTVSITILAIPATAKLVNDSKKLDMALSSQMLVDYCQEKIPRPIPNLHVADQEAIFWNVAKVLFESNPQEKLLNLLGFDRAKLEDQIKKLSLTEYNHRRESQHRQLQEEAIQKKVITDSTSKASPTASHEHDFFGGEAGAEEGAAFDFQSLVNHQEETREDIPAFVERGSENASSSSSRVAPGRRGTFEGVEFQLFAPESSEIDKIITRAIIQGNFEAAVDLCVQADRLSDALLVAICGGEQLVAKTQQIYFQKSRHPYLRVVSGIVKKDLNDVVEHAHIDDWEEILALICSYSQGGNFSHLCNVLGGRIERTIAEERNSPMLTAALICYMAAGNASKAVALLLSQAEGRGQVPDPKKFTEYATWLETVVEKTRIIEQISGYVAPDSVVAIQDVISNVSDKFIEYAYIMAASGLLDIAVRYFNSFSSNRVLGEGEDDLVVIFGDQLAKATKVLGMPLRPIPEPFATPLDVAVEQLAKLEQPHGMQGTHEAHGIMHARQGGFSQANLQQQQQQPQQQQQQQPWGKLPMQNQPAQAGMMQFNRPPPAMPPTGAGGTSAQSFTPSYAAAPRTSPILPPSMPQSQPQQQQQQQYGSTAGEFVQQTPMPPRPMMPMQPISSSSAQLSGTSPYGNAPVAAASQVPASVSPVPLAPTATASPFVPMPRPVMQQQQQQQQQPSGASPTMMPSLMVPAPPRPIASPPPSDASSRRSTGAYNDPPMVAPKIPTAAASAPVQSTYATHMAPTGNIPLAPSVQAQPTPSAAASGMGSKSPQGPVDPSKIPANLQPIHKTFSILIAQCQERALPMQRRVVEDSARRMQALFQQLVNQELSPPVIQIINEMCANINSGQYDRAHELHTPLMTSYFAEAGAWVLAAKRLVEIAKICLH